MRRRESGYIRDMTREEFIEELKKGKYLYDIRKGKLVVTGSSYTVLNVSLKVETLPSGVVFKNDGSVILDFLKELPDDVVFDNDGAVSLTFLDTIHKGAKFNNNGNVEIWGVKSIPVDMEFHNKGLVYTKGPNVFNWAHKVEIEGIDFGRLFNLMIKRGLFL